MLKLHTRQIDTTTMERAKILKRTTKRRQNRIAALGPTFVKNNPLVTLGTRDSHPLS